MTKKIPVYQATVSDREDDGIFAMSFVDFPAVERDFVALSKQKPVKLALDRKKHILSGVVLVPDQLIYRNDNGEYYLQFTATDIERISHKMMRTGLALATTTHQHAEPLAGNYLVEMWIVEDPERDKSVAIGLGRQPKGTLCASYKVSDLNYWRNEVETGQVKGFSLEGFFNLKTVSYMNKNRKPTRKAVPAKNRGAAAFAAGILKSCAALFEGETEAEAEDLVDVAADDNTDSLEPMLVGELAEGGEIHVDYEHFATIDGEQAPAGVHALADGNFIEVDDDGYMVETVEDADDVEPAAADLAAARRRMKQHFAKKPKAKTGTALARENAALKRQIAQLKGAKPARARVERTGGRGAEPTKFERMGNIIKEQRDRRRSN